MNTANIVLLHTDVLRRDYFADFEADLQHAGASVHIETGEEEMQASAAWYAIPVVAIFLLKAFFDAYLKRIADDTVNATYPAIKAATAKLVNKLFRKDPPAISVIASPPDKVPDPTELLFAIFSETADGRRIKFLFRGGLLEQDYALAVSQLFTLLEAHFSGPHDALSVEMAALTNPNARMVLVEYAAGEWHVLDPVTRLRGSGGPSA